MILPSASVPTVIELCVFFFNDTATPEIYTLSLHDALPIYVIQLLHRPDDLEIAVGRHPQTHVDVADDQRGREAVTGAVGDREAEDIVSDRDEVVEIAADDLRRDGPSPDVEAGVLRNAARED